MGRVSPAEAGIPFSIEQASPRHLCVTQDDHATWLDKSERRRPPLHSDSDSVPPGNSLRWRRELPQLTTTAIPTRSTLDSADSCGDLASTSIAYESSGWVAAEGDVLFNETEASAGLTRSLRNVKLSRVAVREMPFGSHAQAVLARSHGEAFIHSADPRQPRRVPGWRERAVGVASGCAPLRGCCSVAGSSGNGKHHDRQCRKEIFTRNIHS